MLPFQSINISLGFDNVWMMIWECQTRLRRWFDDSSLGTYNDSTMWAPQCPLRLRQWFDDVSLGFSGPNLGFEDTLDVSQCFGDDLTKTKTEEHNTDCENSKWYQYNFPITITFAYYKVFRIQMIDEHQTRLWRWFKDISRGLDDNLTMSA